MTAAFGTDSIELNCRPTAARWSGSDEPVDPTCPRISIITPSFNQGEFLEETIQSVIQQGYPDLEYMIIDGGSTDGSIEIIRKYESFVDSWISEKDEGQADAINKGFEKASGQILGWLNSDDLLLPGALYRIAGAYLIRPDAGGWFGECSRISATGQFLSTRRPQLLGFKDLADWERNWVQQPACFFSSQAWEVCGPLDTSLYCALDFDLWLKISKSFEIVKVDGELAAARIHEGAKTRRSRDLMLAETWAVMIRHGFEDEAISSMRNHLLLSRQPTLFSRSIQTARRLLWEAERTSGIHRGARAKRLFLRAILHDPSLLLDADFLRRALRASSRQGERRG